jgi:hypothetical protein
MPNNNNEENKCVYRFVRPDRFYANIEKNLEGWLYFSKWTDFDDKREGKYVCSSTIIDEDSRDILKENLKEKKNEYIVCCTTIKPDIFDLWNRYLETPPAICLKIEISGLKKNQDGFHEKKVPSCESHDDRIFGKPVEYKPKILKLSEEDLDGNAEEKAKKILTTKRYRYQYEEEYRLMCETKNEKGCLIQVGEVKEIILGGFCCKTDTRFNVIRYEAQEKKIPVSYAYMDFKHETVNIIPNADCEICRNITRRRKA